MKYPNMTEMKHLPLKEELERQVRRDKLQARLILCFILLSFGTFVYAMLKP